MSALIQEFTETVVFVIIVASQEKQPKFKWGHSRMPKTEVRSAPQPVHWPRKSAAISLIILGERRSGEQVAQTARVNGGDRVFWGLSERWRQLRSREQRKGREEWLKEQHPEALEGDATNQVSISHVSLPVDLSQKSVAWHGGQRGHEACQTDTGGYTPGKQMNEGKCVHTHKQNTSHIKTSVIQVKYRARLTIEKSPNAWMYPSVYKSCKKKCETSPELCYLILL